MTIPESLSPAAIEALEAAMRNSKVYKCRAFVDPPTAVSDSFEAGYVAGMAYQRAVDAAKCRARATPLEPLCDNTYVRGAYAEAVSCALAIEETP